MKKILFVGAGFFQLDGIKKAKDLGFWTIAIDGNKEAEGKKIADEFFHIDITDKEVVLQLAIEKCIDGVVSIASEVSLDTTSFVATKLKLNGYQNTLIEIAHDKKKYYELFHLNGINVPKTYIYKDAGTLKNISGNNTYFIKPSKGSGSRGVKQTFNLHDFDFKNYAKKYLLNNEEIIIQEMVNGKEMTIDGFISNQEFHLLAVSEELNNKEKGHTFSSELIFPPEWITDKHVVEITKLCNRVVKCLNISCQGPIHLELIKTQENIFYVIDFSLRGGGFDVFTKIIKKTSGIDVLSMYLNSALGEFVSIPLVHEFKPVTLSFIYPEERGIIKKINGKNLEGIYQNYFLKFLYDEEEFIETPESGKQRLAYYICWGKEYKSVFLKRDLIRNQISFEIIYE